MNKIPSEDEKNLFFGGFCFHHLTAATAAATASIFDFLLNSLAVWEFGSLGVSIEFKEEERRRV